MGIGSVKINVFLIAIDINLEYIQELEEKLN